jgi:hypothetical protein
MRYDFESGLVRFYILFSWLIMIFELCFFAWRYIVRALRFSIRILCVTKSYGMSMFIAAMFRAGQYASFLMIHSRSVYTDRIW